MRFWTKSILLSALLLTVGCGYHSSFSDQSLEKKFRANETDFNKLVQMLKEDSTLSSITAKEAYQGFQIKATTATDRLDEYRRIMAKLELNSLSRIEGTDKIYFAVWNRGDFPYGGTNEYFVYAEFSPSDARYLVDSLDRLRTQRDAYAYKKIADRWYLHVDNW